jgi:serine/threonine protein kinase
MRDDSMIGSRLAHYEITDHLGSGGMGEVYQATDSRLGRSVAIKLLPEAFATDAERVARFQREARVLASLNHPHIAGIHGIEESGGRVFLVLELVSGETLADKIARGPIPLDEALAIATQIAEALEAAHDAGVIHRDLKPANVKLTSGGDVKVLDFGLAKALSNEQPDLDPTYSPTMSLAATQRGVIMGTAAYMSPEQARGKVVDRRADIWAFGVVLYEMVTGQRLFKGEDYTDTLAAVVREKPDLNAAPSAIRPVLEKCLEKDPKRRMRHISAFPLLVGSGAADKSQVIPRASSSASRSFSWLLAGALAITVAALAFVHFREVPPAVHSVQFVVDPPPNLYFTNQYGGFAPSPDGRYVVFTVRADAGPQLWLRPLDSTTSRPLPGTDNGNYPIWSPDSKSLAFTAASKLKRIEIAGGAPLTLADASDPPVSPTGSWAPSGIILFGSGEGLMRVSASGGGATAVTKVNAARKETGHGYPQLLPDGDRFIFFIASSDTDVQGVYSSSLSRPEQHQQILRTAAKAVFVPGAGRYPDYLLWMQEQTLLAQEFDPKALMLKGDPISIAEGIGQNPNTPIRAAYWASDAGLLIYFNIPLQRKRPLSWITKGGAFSEAVPEDTFQRVALSPTDDRIALTRIDPATQPPNTDIWVRELKRGLMTRFTFDAMVDDYPVWSPDGKQIAFSSNRAGGVLQVFRKDVSGAGIEEQLTESPNGKTVLDWSHDGKYILYREQNPKTARDLMMIPVEGERKPVVVANTEFLENTGTFSPDDRWIAYASNDAGNNQIFVKAVPGRGGPAGKWQISSALAYDVRWRGNVIYYQTQDNKVMAVTVQTSAAGVRAESPRQLFTAEFQRGALREFDVTSDGERFLLIINKQQVENEHLTIVSNWQSAIRK